MTTLMAIAPPLSESPPAKRPLLTAGADGAPWPHGGSGPVGEHGYMHYQDLAAKLWTIPHGLNGYPAVTVQSTGGSQATAEVTWVSLNQVQILWEGLMGGWASLTLESDAANAAQAVEGP